MVSRAHRFLRGRVLATAEPVWRLTANTDNIFFHDAYLGCLLLAATIRHWAQEQGHRRRDSPRPGRPRPCNDAGAADAARPPTGTRAHLDQLAHLSNAFGSPGGRSIVAVVEGLPEQCEGVSPEDPRDLQRTMRMLVQRARAGTGGPERRHGAAALTTPLHALLRSFQPYSKE